MATLYELKDDFLTLYEMLECDDYDEETLLDTLEGVEGEIEDKAEGYAKVMRQLQSEVEASKAEEARLAENRRRKQAQIDRMNEYLAKSLLEIGRTKMTTTLFSFSFRKSDSVVVDDMNQIPMDYLKFKDPEADKTAIKKAIKDGKDIPGVHIETKQNLQIK